MQDITNFFRLEKEAKAIKDRILRDINNLFEHEEEENYWSKYYIEYESNSDRNKKLLVEECFTKIRPYLKATINNPKNMTRGKFI